MKNKISISQIIITLGFMFLAYMLGQMTMHIKLSPQIESTEKKIDVLWQTISENRLQVAGIDYSIME